MQLKSVLVRACALVCLAATTAAPAWARDVLRVGLEPTFAPFEFLDTKSKQFVGYDIDLVTAVADEAGYDVEIVNMGFDALIAALRTGTIDVIASGLTITEERSKRVDFTTPYYTAGLSMLVRKADAKRYSDFKSLEGARIAVQIGTTGADFAKRIANAQVVAFNANSEAFMDLSAGNSAAVVHDRPVLAYFLRNQPRAARDLQLQPGIEEAQQYGFAVKKGRTDLLNALNAGYDRVVKSGQKDRIENKWFAQ